MARTALTKTTAEGVYGDYGADEADVTMAAADTVNQNSFTYAGYDLVIAHNTGAGAHTVTITSLACAHGRTGDISYSLGAGEIAVFGPFNKSDGWQQSDGKVYLEADSAEVEFGVVALPG